MRNVKLYIKCILVIMFVLTGIRTEAGFLTGAWRKLKNAETISYYAFMQGGNANSMAPQGYEFAWFEITYNADTPKYAEYGMNKQTYELVFVGKKGNKDVYEMTPRVADWACHYILFEHDSDGTINKNAVTHEYYYNGNIGLVTVCSSSAGPSSGSGSYASPSNGGGNSNNNSNRKSSTRRTCPGCNGTGKGPDQITYAPNYTGKDNSRYCSICGRTTAAHSHHSSTCRTCGGKGYVE